MRKRALAAIFFLVLFTYLFVLQIRAIWPFTIDDMYISLRYAKHMQEGQGLVWNVGFSPVEGYSNFLFVLISASVMWLSLSPVIFLKLTGVFGLALTAVALYKLARFWYYPYLAWIPLAWLLSYKGQIIWAVSGLETTIYQALICFSLVFLWRGMGYRPYPGLRKEPSLSYMMLAALALVVASLTRPEAPAFMVIFTLLLLVHGYLTSSSKQYWRACCVFFLVFIACFAPYFLWRWFYFGRLFPNPVYCKGFNVFEFSLDAQYLKLIAPLMCFALPVLWSKRDIRSYFLCLPSLLYLGLLIGADPVVAFDNRLFLPALVLLLPLVLRGITQLTTIFLARRDEVYTVTVYLISFLLIFFFIPTYSLSEYQRFSLNPQRGEHLRNQVAQWLQLNTNPNAQVVLADSGLIPYKIARHFIDSYCLNNLEMTTYSSEVRYQVFCERTLIKKPEIIVLTSLIKPHEIIYTPADNCFRKSNAFQSQYHLQRTFISQMNSFSYRYEVYVLKPFADT